MSYLSYAGPLILPQLFSNESHRFSSVTVATKSWRHMQLTRTKRTTDSFRTLIWAITTGINYVGCVARCFSCPTHSVPRLASFSAFSWLWLLTFVSSFPALFLQYVNHSSCVIRDHITSLRRMQRTLYSTTNIRLCDSAYGLGHSMDICTPMYWFCYPFWTWFGHCNAEATRIVTIFFSALFASWMETIRGKERKLDRKVDKTTKRLKFICVDLYSIALHIQRLPHILTVR